MILVHQSNTLRLTDVQVKDKGLYTCVANNNIKPADSFGIGVNVLHRPQCAAVKDRVGQAQNRRFDATLDCKVSGGCSGNTQLCTGIKLGGGQLVFDLSVSDNVTLGQIKLNLDLNFCTVNE